MLLHSSTAENLPLLPQVSGTARARSAFYSGPVFARSSEIFRHSNTRARDVADTVLQVFAFIHSLGNTSGDILSNRFVGLSFAIWIFAATSPPPASVKW